MLEENFKVIFHQLKDEYRLGYEILKQDLVFSKIPQELHRDLIIYAQERGREAFEYLKEEISLEEPLLIAEKLGIKIIIDNSSIGLRKKIILRSEYRPKPPQVIVYEKSLQILKGLLEKENIKEFLPLPDLLSLHIAHELFHHLEYVKIGLVSRRLRVYTFKFGPFRLSSEVKSLSEIAAHTFCQKLLNLDFSPYILDVLAAQATLF